MKDLETEEGSAHLVPLEGWREHDINDEGTCWCGASWDDGIVIHNCNHGTIH